MKHLLRLAIDTHGACYHFVMETKMLPFAIRIPLMTALALNAIGSVIGPEHVMLGQSESAMFGILVTAGIVLHEAGTMASNVAKGILRWWRRRR